MNITKTYITIFTAFATLMSLLSFTAMQADHHNEKTALRFNGHCANLCFDASTFFVTPNFADTYSPLMPLLEEGYGPSAQ